MPAALFFVYVKLTQLNKFIKDNNNITYNY